MDIVNREMDFGVDEKLIEIKQDNPGFNGFFASWLCQDDLKILIDAGPASTAGRLIDSLDSMGLARVDYILLTHIHIDHAGGLADLLGKFPMARVICHEKALKYLGDPSRLWAGSLKVLGKIAEMYGPPKPVPMERLIPHTECEVKDLLIIETPGHAPHHLSFCYRNRLFAGEAGGNYFVVNQREYLRPATPPRFFLDACLKRIDRLLALENQPICYAHFGRAGSSHRLLQVFRDQLMRWKEMIYEEILKGNEDLIKRCMDTLFEKDPNLAAFNQMAVDTRERERIFMANAIKGFVGFFQEKGQK